MATNPTPQDIPDDQPEPPKPVPKPVPKPPVKKKEDSPKPINPEFTQEPSKNFAKGGSVRGGGCEIRGKTKGKMV